MVLKKKFVFNYSEKEQIVFIENNFYKLKWNKHFLLSLERMTIFPIIIKFVSVR